jgi:hypothetical protein
MESAERDQFAVRSLILWGIVLSEKNVIAFELNEI